MIVDILVGFFSAILAAMGVGGGGLLVVYLTVFKNVSQLTAQGINLIYFLPSASISVFSRRKKLFSDWKTVLVMCLTGTAASVAASLFVGHISAKILKVIFGALLVFAGVYQFAKSLKKSDAKESKEEKKRKMRLR